MSGIVTQIDHSFTMVDMTRSLSPTTMSAMHEAIRSAHTRSWGGTWTPPCHQLLTKTNRGDR
eukprot:6748022-Karenia_brevis.AAC.1